MGIFSSFFNPTKNQNKAYGQAIAGQQQANALTQPFYEQSINSATGANTRLADLLNLNGAGAQRTALDQFTQSPAAQANIDAGLQALDQSAAARGILMSGDHTNRLRQFGQDQYNNEYQSYLANLGRLQNGGFAGASGISGNASQLGELQVGLGASKDAGNQAGLSNMLGLAGAAFGRLF